MEEFHQYIIDSKINGNHSQVKNLIKEMSKKEIGEFCKWANDEANLTDLDRKKDYNYCFFLALDILAGSE